LAAGPDQGLALAALGGGRWERSAMLLSYPYLAFSVVLRLLVRRRHSEFAQRRRTARVATSARRARPARTPALAAARRSCVACGSRPTASTAAASRTGGDATDASALASGARASQVDEAATKSGPSARRSPRARARAALRTGEPRLGLSADRRGTRVVGAVPTSTTTLELSFVKSSREASIPGQAQVECKGGRVHHGVCD
jgi:hypothetical protein